MLGMDRGYVIKHKWHHEGLSIRQIAGDLEVSRNTVRKYLYAEGEPRRRESDKRPQPVLDEVRERIDEILQEWGRRTMALGGLLLAPAGSDPALVAYNGACQSQFGRCE